MITKITHVTLRVEDYDDAISWYTDKLGLELRMDNAFGDGGRFVTVDVRDQDVEIVLFKPFGERESAGLEQPVSGIHGFVFGSGDCRIDADDLRNRGVKVTQGPEEVPWGTQAVFEDLYGNTHVLGEARQ